MRRFVAIEQGGLDVVKKMVGIYRARGEPAAIDGPDAAKGWQSAGQLVTPNRFRAKRMCSPQGPVGYLLEDLFLQASGMDNDLVIHSETHPCIKLDQMPYQQLTKAIKEIGIKNRTRDACSTRLETIDLFEVDVEATKTAKGKFDQTQLMQLDVVKTAAKWTAEAAYWAGKKTNQTCQLCNCERETTDHFWRCTALAEVRKEADPGLAAIDPERIHVAMKIGVAPALDVDPMTPFWGRRFDLPTKRLANGLWETTSGNIDATDELFGVTNYYDNDRDLLHVVHEKKVGGPLPGILSTA